MPRPPEVVAFRSSGADRSVPEVELGSRVSKSSRQLTRDVQGRRTYLATPRTERDTERAMSEENVEIVRRAWEFEGEALEHFDPDGRNPEADSVPSPS